ncbi:L-threonylcarbamoyladenylate synthase [Nitrospira sp. Kam-Ns4a]
MDKATVLPAGEPASIAIAADVIRAGGLVAFPTETVYGLGANAMDPQAVAKVFEAKQRPRFDPLIVHVADREALERLVLEVDPLARQLIAKFWPGPLTLVLPKRPCVLDLVTAGLPTVAVRMPAHPVAQALLRQAGTPIAAPSANPFGSLSPTHVQHVQDTLGGRVDVILDGGACPIGVESTIVSLAADPPQLLRPGAVPSESIKKVVGALARVRSAELRPLAPGLLPRHYATRTPLHLLPHRGALPACDSGERIGLLAFSVLRAPGPYAAIEVLSEHGSLVEAARNLFATLHRLDSLALDRLYAEPCGERGLGAAIMDRLRRCAEPLLCGARTGPA